MNRVRSKARMKVIPGGKQLSLIRDTEEILKFLEFTAKTGSEDSAVIEARYRACAWCFSLVKEEEDHVAWIFENLPVILSRQNEIMGHDLESTADLIKAALEDYRFWSSDPFGWERKQLSLKPESSKATTSERRETGRTLTFPIRTDLCIEMKIPEGGISTEEFLKLGLFLYPYCNDLDLTKSFSWINPTEKN